MTRRMLNIVFAAVLASGAAPVLAQENPKVGGGGPGGGEQAGSRPSNGNTTGSAVDRPSGGSGGGNVSSGSSSGSASSGGSSGSGSAGSMPSAGNGGFAGVDRPRSPERRTDRAVTRGNDRPSPGVRSEGRTNSAPSVDASSDQRRAVPAYSRPRGGQTQTGEAIDRRNAPVRGGNGNIIYYPYYDPYFGYGYGYGSGSRYGYGFSPWYGGYGFGLGYFYDPWGYSYYSPYNNDYDSYGQGGYGRSTYRPYGQSVGQLRLKVKPEQGQVYVDGYYAGDVDSFDGVFQRLAIEAGPHKVEIRAPGYETVVFDVMITPGQTVTYKGEMRRIK